MFALIFDGLWWAALAISLMALAYLLLAMAAVATLRLRAHPDRSPGWTRAPSVTLLKPMCGDEDGLGDALDSFLAQATDAPVHFVFGVAERTDSALPVLRAALARYPMVSAQIVIDDRSHGPNPKVSNLVNMAEAAQDGLGEVVVISDSDILAAPGVLQRALEALAVPGMGAVTALYRARPGSAEGVQAHALGAWFIDYWFLPMAVLHARLAPLSVTYGPLTAVRGEALARIGGLRALAPHLSDDAALGRLVRAAGWKIGFSPDVVETLVNDEDITELFDHELRWARTVRGLDPIGYIASMVSHPGPLPLLLLLRPGLWALIGIFAPILAHWVLALLTARKLGRSSRVPLPGPWGIWKRDVLSWLVWCIGLLVREVGWRGQRLTVAEGDVLEDEE
jgi:ceramide glucosyltransferase